MVYFSSDFSRSGAYQHQHLPTFPPARAFDLQTLDITPVLYGCLTQWKRRQNTRKLRDIIRPCWCNTGSWRPSTLTRCIKRQMAYVWINFRIAAIFWGELGVEEKEGKLKFNLSEKTVTARIEQIYDMDTRMMYYVYSYEYIRIHIHMHTFITAIYLL